MKNNKSPLLAIAVIALLAAFLFDMQIWKFFLDIQLNLIASLMEIISLVGSWYFVLIVTTLIFIITKRKKYVIASWAALLSGLICSTVLKILIARPRPVLGIDSSFPSIHAMSVFAVLPLLDKKTRKYWLIFAILVGISRMYLGAHYASDVIAGSLIGYLFGYLSLRIFKLKSK